MSRLGSRVFVPLVSLAIGTWIGLGSPYGDVAKAATKRAVLAVTGDRSAIVAPHPDPVPPDATPQTVNIRGLTDNDEGPLPNLNPDGTIARAWLLAEGPAYAPDEAKHYVTFTFDDGPFPETTPHILDLLEWNHVHATFFVIGKYLEGEDARSNEARALLLREVAAGHVVGNHTYDHRHLTEVTRANSLKEIDEGASLIARATGQTPLFFRPPYGDLSRFLEHTLAERGTQVVLWSIEAEDMKRDDPDAIFEDLKRRIEYAGGGIVLLHDVRPSSAHAFAKLLHWLNENRYDAEHPEVHGYKVVGLEDYIRATAASPQPFATRQAVDDARKAAWLKANRGQMPPPPQALAGPSAKSAEIVL